MSRIPLSSLTRAYYPTIGSMELRKRLRGRTAALGLLGGWLLWAPFLAGQPASPDPLLRWMDGIAQQQLRQRQSVIAGIHNTAEAEQRKQAARRTFLELIGGLSSYSGPLNAKITGRLQDENTAIE